MLLEGLQKAPKREKIKSEVIRHGLEKLGIVAEMRAINRKQRGQEFILTEDSLQCP